MAQTHVGVDEDRVVIFGNSYGGYHVYVQLVKHPMSWTVALAWNGYIDWGGDDAFRMADHAAEIERPLLMLHSVRDHPSIEHGRQLRDALEENGADFEYHELEDEGHYSLEREKRLRRLGLIGLEIPVSNSHRVRANCLTSISIC